MKPQQEKLCCHLWDLDKLINQSYLLMSLGGVPVWLWSPAHFTHGRLDTAVLGLCWQLSLDSLKTSRAICRPGTIQSYNLPPPHSSSRLLLWPQVYWFSPHSILKSSLFSMLLSLASSSPAAALPFCPPSTVIAHSHLRWLHLVSSALMALSASLSSLLLQLIPWQQRHLSLTILLAPAALQRPNLSDLTLIRPLCHSPKADSLYNKGFSISLKTHIALALKKNPYKHYFLVLALPWTPALVTHSYYISLSED